MDHLNLVETFAFYMMALNWVGDDDANFDLKEFKEDSPKSFEIIKKIIDEI